ncbi:MAG: cytidine deaminase [Planctomycetaceae bacterium]|nr:cytidine deaminase [Planctomycetaceae bacterium]
MSNSSPSLPDSWHDLRAAARAVREAAYAPYSQFHVGAALLTSRGKIFRGCNVENASYGGTICAERMAVGAAIAAGERDIAAICISLTGTPVPCGICRQFLYEFNPDMLVLLDDLNDGAPAEPECLRLSDLLPRGFRLDP